jgi:hypothetical protein
LSSQGDEKRGKPVRQSGATAQQGVFHRPSELNQDFEALLFLGEIPLKSLDVAVKWVMKNTNPAAALAWLAASERLSSPC